MSDSASNFETEFGATNASTGNGHDKLCPNRIAINEHLFRMFSPAFVKDHPDTKIEIAWSDPAAVEIPGKKRGIDQGRTFSAFDLQKPADFAEKKNRAGFNVYIGAALRRGECNGRASKEDIVAGSRTWADFDDAGDDVRVTKLLNEKAIKPSDIVQTGKTPHRRFQIYIELAGTVTPQQLETANTALRDWLGGDDVQGMQGLMRLAGTVNYPTRDKQARGYIPEVVTLLVASNAPAYTVEHLLSVAGIAATDPWEDITKENKRGRSDDEVEALLEASKAEGKWHINMRDAIATMVGRGWSDSAIRMSCKQYLRDGYGDSDINDFINRGRKKWNKPDTEATVQDSKARIEQLARMSLLAYDQVRKQAAKELGVRVAMLDGLVDAARDDFHKQKADAKAATTDPDIARINANYALVLAGNKAAVMKFEDATKFRLLQIGAFTTWFANRMVGVGQNAVALGDYWLGHSQRRQYAGIEFAPTGTAATAGYYNLFQGFAVEPRQGDCSKFLAHLKDNAARGDEQTYLWILGWWAQIFQQPSVKMETALAFRGGFGTGKTKIGQVFGELMRDHYLLVASPRYITGQFNSHMASLLVLHADEAFWGGDKKGEGTLKDLVSGKQHLLEYKGVDVISIKNFVRLFVTGNLDWMVPAGFRDRRWAIFDIGEGRMQDHAYFAAIDEEMNNGGREALLHHLLNFDLSQVNLRTIPRTTALLDQQIESLTPEQAWWLDVLMSGMLPPEITTSYANACLRNDLYQHYVRHARLQGTSHRSIETKIGMFLNDLLGADLQDVRLNVEGQRRRVYVLPPLAVCRMLFDQKMGQPVNWGADWENEDWQHAEPWQPNDHRQPEDGGWDPDTGYYAKKAAEKSEKPPF